MIKVTQDKVEIGGDFGTILAETCMVLESVIKAAVEHSPLDRTAVTKKIFTAVNDSLDKEGEIGPLEESLFQNYTLKGLMSQGENKDD